MLHKLLSVMYVKSSIQDDFHQWLFIDSRIRIFPLGCESSVPDFLKKLFIYDFNKINIAFNIEIIEKNNDKNVDFTSS